MHGKDEHSCEGYFCYEHRPVFVNEANGSICEGCAKALEDSGDWERIDGDELVKKS